MKAPKKIVKKELNVDEELKKLGARIKQLRIAKGYKNYELFAYEHGIPRAQFGRYENGQDLRYSSLLKVIDALDVTVQEFFKENP